MEKLKILVFKPNDGGCSYYRCISPAKKLEEKFSHAVEIRWDDNPLRMNPENGQVDPNWNFDTIKWADIVWTNNIPNFGAHYLQKVIQVCYDNGKLFHFDTDDLLTELYSGHRLEGLYKEQKLSDFTKEVYRHSHLVTVTQRKFAEYIKEHIGVGVLAVVKNAIDYNLPGWNIPKKPSKKVRIIWAAGIHHEEDVKEFASVPGLVNQLCGKENIEWILLGHPGNPPPGKKKEWQHQVWDNYINKFTKGLKGAKNLKVFPALPPSDYGVYLSEGDIAIAPLQMNKFNDSKCLQKGEQVIMYDGSIKKVEDIKIDDLLLGPDSLPRKVLSLSSGKEEMVRVIPKRNKSFVVTKDHILSLKTNDKVLLRTKEQIINITVNDYLKKNKSFKTNYRLYSTGVDFSNSHNLPLDPYFVGIMLGDGSFKNVPRITTMDEEIRQYFENYCLTNFSGLKIHVDRKKGNKAATYSATKKLFNCHIKNPIMIELGKIGLAGLTGDRKFIPNIYKTASREERLQLLAGLIDTDGSCGSNNTSYTFTNKSKQLTEDVAFVARSLGLHVHPVTEFKVPSICYTTYYRASISGNIDIVPCKLKRKFGAKRKAPRDSLTSGFKIEEVGLGEYYGFKVDGDGLFLLDDFTVTHNSDIKVAECARYKIPLIASNVGCYEDTIVNGKTGYLVPVGAKPIEWAKIIAKVVKDKKHREALGENLQKQFMDQFDLNKVVENRLYLYSEFLKLMKKLHPEGTYNKVWEYPLPENAESVQK